MLTVEVEIGQEFRSSIARAEQAVERAITDAMSIAAMEAANEARRRAPYKTGTLRRSIEVKEMGPRQVAVGSGQPYAARIEFGFAGRDSLGRLYNQPAKPYLRPAIEETRQRMAQVFAEEVRRALGGR
jgi:HK97 gp10 family phage protein